MNFIELFDTFPTRTHSLEYLGPKKTEISLNVAAFRVQLVNGEPGELGKQVFLSQPTPVGVRIWCCYACWCCYE